MRPTFALRMFRASPRMMNPVPKEDQAAHTISQRLRKIKRIPPELYPLGVVVAGALGFAAYSSARHFFTDSAIRLKRQGPPPQSHGSHGGHGGEEKH
jgi:hypothetical protein